MMRWTWTTRKPTKPGVYWTMQGGCCPVMVQVRHQFEEFADVIDEASNPLIVRGFVDGDCQREWLLSEAGVVCWCGPLAEPPAPPEYYEYWRRNKPGPVEASV